MQITVSIMLLVIEVMVHAEIGIPYKGITG